MSALANDAQEFSAVNSKERRQEQSMSSHYEEINPQTAHFRGPLHCAEYLPQKNVLNVEQIVMVGAAFDEMDIALRYEGERFHQTSQMSIGYALLLFAFYVAPHYTVLSAEVWDELPDRI